MRPEDEGLAGAMKVVLAGALGLGLGLAAGGLVLWKDRAAGNGGDGAPPSSAIPLAGENGQDGTMAANYLTFEGFTVRLAANRLGGDGASYAIDGGLVEATRALIWEHDGTSLVAFAGSDFRSPRSGLDYLFAGWTVDGRPDAIKTRVLRVPARIERNITAHWITAKR